MGVITTLTDGMVGAPLGAPILPVELSVTDVDRQLALLKYYSFVPIKSTKEYSFTTSREVTQQILDLLPVDNNGNPDQNYFYVGVMSFATRLFTTAPRMNEYLLGTPYMFPNEEPETQAYINTLWDYNIGDVYYEEKPDLGLINWVVGGSLVLAAVYGIGCMDIEKTPYRHVELIGHLIGVNYYKRLLAIRKTGKFNNADFTLDTSVLENALKEAIDRSTEILESISMIPITSG